MRNLLLVLLVVAAFGGGLATGYALFHDQDADTATDNAVAKGLSAAEKKWVREVAEGYLQAAGLQYSSEAALTWGFPDFKQRMQRRVEPNESRLVYGFKRWTIAGDEVAPTRDLVLVKGTVRATRRSRIALAAVSSARLKPLSPSRCASSTTRTADGSWTVSSLAILQGESSLAACV